MSRRFALLACAIAVWAGPAYAQTVAGGFQHSVVVTPDGTVWTWGDNSVGQLGDGSINDRTVPSAVSALTNITAVAAGGQHTLALKSDGTVWAWGYNWYGQLGDGTSQNTRTTPVAVLGLSNVVAIAAGDYHSVALTDDGHVYTWGRNSNGQLGDGSTNLATQPVLVSTVTASAIAAGASHTLVVKLDATVWGWGLNGNGQLGDGTPTQRTSPVQMTGVADASAVAAGSAHSLVLKSDGTLLATGYNQQGQLGNNSQTQSTSAVAVSVLTNVTAIRAADSQSYAIRSDGSVYAWGRNDSGRLGDGSFLFRKVPTHLTAISSITGIGAGQAHAIAVSSTGVVWTWGANADGQLGDGTRQGRATPGAISGPAYDWKVGTPVLSLAGGTYSVEKTLTVTVATAGAEIHYTLNGADPTESDALIVSGGTITIDQTRTFKAKAWKNGMPSSDIASATYTMVVATPLFSPTGTTYGTAQTVTLSTSSPGVSLRYTTDGSTPTESSTLYTSPLLIGTSTTVKAAGFRTNWQSSTVATATYTMNFGTLAAPTFDVPGGTYTSQTVVAITAAPEATIRYTTDGTTPGTSSPVYVGPVTVASNLTLRARAFHPDYTTSSTTTGTYTIVVAAPTLAPAPGTYAAGQLITVSTATSGATLRYTLNGLEPTTSDPVIASGGTLVAGNFTLKVKGWKSGATTSNTVTGTYAVSGEGTAPRIAGGSSHSVAIRGDGLVFAWGMNHVGQLGDGTSTRRLLPTVVNGITGATQVAAGGNTSLAVASGMPFGWGANGGQLGDNSTGNRLNPVSPVDLSAVTKLAAGPSFSLALKNDRTLIAYGANGSGQLGDGFTTTRLSPVAVLTLTDVIDVAAGSAFSLAAKADGSVWSWGTNSNGQLGIGTTGTGRATPGVISSLSSATALAAGSLHALALLADGTVRSWGNNANGRLGDGTTMQRTSPVTVTGLSSVIALAAGDSHSLALDASGTVWAWGSNFHGRLGDGTTTDRWSPVAVQGLPPIIAVGAGASHSLAVAADLSVWTWGRNNEGQLGDGTQIDRVTPVQIADAAMSWKVAAPTLSIAAGLYYTPQHVVVTGNDPDATLHYTTNGASPTTADPAIASGSTAVVDQSLTLKVRAWKPGAVASEVTSAVYELKVVTPTLTPASGGYESAKQVSVTSTTANATFTYTVDGTEPTSSSTVYTAPFEISDTRTVRARAYRIGWTASDSAAASYWIMAGTVATPTIAPAGGAHSALTLVTMACTTTGATIRYTVDGSDPTPSSPIYRLPLVISRSMTVKAKAFRAGYNASATASSTFAIDPAGQTPTPILSSAGGWFTTQQTVTVTAPADHTVRFTLTGVDPTETDAIFPAGGLTIATSSLLKVRAWKTGFTPSAVARADSAITGAVAAGFLHSLALTADGEVFAWGDNGYGQLGDGTTQPRAVPTPVLTGAVAIAAGRNFSLAVKRDGSVVGWGEWFGGLSPTSVGGLTDIAGIAAGDDHALALRRDGTVLAWGWNRSGQLGNGSTSTQWLSTPTPVVGLRNVRSIAAGQGFSLAVEDEGAGTGIVWAWGQNTHGQLGDDSTVPRTVPVRIAGLEGVVEVAAGQSFGVARLADGSVRTWGRNDRGQLGRGSVSTSAPVGSLSSVASARLIAGGLDHALAADAAGRLWGWGDNLSHEVGSPPDPTPAAKTSPSLFAHLPAVLAAAGGYRHTVAVRADGSVWAFGSGVSTVGPISPTNGTQMSGVSIGDQSALVSDQDSDSLATWRELMLGTDPLNADTNGNGLTDGVEVLASFSGAHADDDGDGLASEVEIAAGTDPFVADSDHDGVNDALDAFPLDPTRTAAPTPTPGDTTPPVITLTEPTTARPRPPLD